MTPTTEHPTVRAVRSRPPRPAEPLRLDRDELRRTCLEAGADDVGFVEVERPELADQRREIERLLPGARMLVSFVVRMSRDNIRTPARSVANLEFHHAGDEVNEVARRIVQHLEGRGIRSVNPAMGFPMEMDRFPGRIWTVAHKPVAVAAGLGHMGIHRNVIHPLFGNFILLGTVVVAAEVDGGYSRPVDYNPCLECKLCVAACPTGAIGADGSFDFAACYTHNYREFMGGFTDWVENVADSKDRTDYRGRVSDAETVSMWQSLSYGANYKAAYCLAACPAGEDVIGTFFHDRKRHLDQVVRPLQKKEEAVYVVRGSDAEEHVRRRFPHKTVRHVGNGLHPVSIAGFLDGMRFTFQPGRAAGLDATYHFTFTGDEPAEATVTIRDGKLRVERGHHGTPGLRLTADSRTWLRFLAREIALPWAMLRGGIRFRGSPRLLLAFARCFPS